MLQVGIKCSMRDNLYALTAAINTEMIISDTVSEHQ